MPVPVPVPAEEEVGAGAIAVEVEAEVAVKLVEVEVEVALAALRAAIRAARPLGLAPLAALPSAPPAKPKPFTGTRGAYRWSPDMAIRPRSVHRRGGRPRAKGKLPDARRVLRPLPLARWRLQLLRWLRWMCYLCAPEPEPEVAPEPLTTEAACWRKPANPPETEEES